MSLHKSSLHWVVLHCRPRCNIALWHWSSGERFGVLQYCISLLSSLVLSIAVLQYWREVCSIASARGLEWQYRPIRENRCCLQGASCANYPVHSPTSCTLCTDLLYHCGSEDRVCLGGTLSHPSRHSGISHTRSSVMPAKPGLP